MTRRGGERRVVLLLGNLGTGGTQRQAVLLARALPRQGWRPIVVVVDPLKPEWKATVGGLKAAGVNVYTLGANLSGGTASPAFWGRLAGAVMRLRTIAARERASVIQSFLFWQNMLAVPAGRLHPTVRAVVTGRRNLGFAKDQRPAYRHLENLANRFADAIVCNAKAVARDTRQREQNVRGRLTVIPNGVEAERFAGAAEGGHAPLREFLAGARPVVGAVANLKAHKNLGLFLDTVAALAQTHPNVGGFIAGRDLGEGARLRERIAAMALGDRVLLHDSGDPVEGVYALMDVLLLTSTAEGMPNVVLEAMAAGVPVVSSYGGARELMGREECGLVLPGAGAEELAQAVADLLADEPGRRRLVEAGRGRVRRVYTPERLAARHARLYDRLTSS